MRRNFHALLGQRIQNNNKNFSLSRLYDKNYLDSLYFEFTNIISQERKEEILQKFIENNPIILHMFPAERLFFKPPILTKFKADFAIVNPQKELILIEIERPSTRLLKKDGSQHAELTHAIGQIQNWLHVADEHRQAFLDSLDIPRESVGKIRGVVVAGRDKGNDAEHLRRLKGVDNGKITLLTYDDLASSLAHLASTIAAL